MLFRDRKLESALFFVLQGEQEISTVDGNEEKGVTRLKTKYEWCQGPLCIRHDSYLSICLGLVTVKSGVSLSLSSVLETRFLLLGCIVQS